MSLENHDPSISLDDQYNSLLDGRTLVSHRKAAEKRFENLSTDQWKYLRLRAKNDLFFLSYGVLGFKRLSVNLHGHLCSWLEHTRAAQFREELLPRGHFKSTIVTIADAIQIVLTDDLGDSIWPRNLGTNCRLAIIHETHATASGYLYAITGNFLTNPTLMGLFPECVPSPKKHRINKEQLELPRDESWAEPTIDTMGVGARGQGRHYNFLKLDDLIGDKARDSKTEMESAKTWFDNIQSFFSKFGDDKFDLIGTRWSFDDLYAHAHEVYGDQLKRYVRGVEELNPVTGKIEAIFPEEFTPSKLSILRKNTKIFSAQYANDPREGATSFDKGWKRYYQWLSGDKIAIFSGDSHTVVRRSELDIVFLVDPAVSGLFGLCVTGTDSKNRTFVLEAIKGIKRPPEFTEFIFALVQKWWPRTVAIEHELFSEVFSHWWQREMGFRGVRFNISPVTTKKRAKAERVMKLSNYFSAGMIYFHESQKELIEEFDNFGATSNYHILDSLAYGPEIWRAGSNKAIMDQNAAAAKSIMSGRDPETGYSLIL